ncbi:MULTISPECIES: SPFH domain-containing protein [unclassified Streptomyces]|uniref:SPFH domain-containing protein n=1 Tax=unclassified Streptomyces TaxID=2593676 RepID=UPI002B1CF959|nr:MULTISPECIES: SPFH domain-containing protein [unclassified Streptomyces]
MEGGTERPEEGAQTPGRISAPLASPLAEASGSGGDGSLGARTGRGSLVVRPYRDPLVLGPLFRDEEQAGAPATTAVRPDNSGARGGPGGPGRPHGPGSPGGDGTPGRPRGSHGTAEPDTLGQAAVHAAIPRPARPVMAAPNTPRTLPAVLDPELTEHPARACSGWWALLTAALATAGAAALARFEELRPSTSPAEVWPLAVVVCCALLTLAALCGLRRGRAGRAWSLTLFGRYRGTIRRTGLIWSNPLPRHTRVDVRLRHWRSEPLCVVDSEGTALRSVVLVVWRVRDTARALLAVDDHAAYLSGQVESATARVLSRMPADSFGPEPAGPQTLRDTEAVGDELTRLLAAECKAVGIEVFSARPLHVEYAPEVAAAMQRRRVASIDARHRDSVLTSVLDAVDDTVHRMSDRGLVSLDDYERKALVKDLTVAFYTARGPAADAR